MADRHPYDRQPCTLCPGGVCAFTAPERDPAYVPGTLEYEVGLARAQLAGAREYPIPNSRKAVRPADPRVGGPATRVWLGTHEGIVDSATGGGAP